jgi:hypothetical protein
MQLEIVKKLGLHISIFTISEVVLLNFVFFSIVGSFLGPQSITFYAFAACMFNTSKAPIL